MSNDLVPFLFQGTNLIRAIVVDGEPLFVANDVAAALGYARPDNAASRHCKLVRTCPLETGGSFGR